MPAKLVDARGNEAPLQVYTGDDVTWHAVLWMDRYKTEPFVVTDAEVAGQIRAEHGSVVLADFVCAVVDANTISFGLTAAESATLVPGDYRFDIQVTTVDDKVVTVLAGIVHVDGDITT